MSANIQTSTTPPLATGTRKIVTVATCVGNGTGTPTADARNVGVVFTRTAKGVIRATLSQLGTIYPMSVQVKTLHVPTDKVRVAAAVKALSATGGTLDIDVVNEALPAQMQVDKAADGAANTATAEYVVFHLPAACTISAAHVMPTAAVTADAANNATLTLKGYTAAGASGVSLATLVTDVAGGSWTALVQKAMTLTGTTANLDREADSAVTLTITKGGLGVQLPALTLRLTLDRHIDLTSSERLYLDLVINEMSV